MMTLGLAAPYLAMPVLKSRPFLFRIPAIDAKQYTPDEGYADCRKHPDPGFEVRAHRDRQDRQPRPNGSVATYM
jgi:hypothetical protein